MFTFYIITLLISIAFYPFVSKVFKNMPDKGYPFSRIIGVLAFTYLLFITRFVFKSDFSTITLLIVLMCFLAVAIKKTDFRALPWKTLVFEEIFFVLIFVGMIMFRGAQPRIQGIEKFMDFGIINGLLRDTNIPPQDVWLSGLSINYYYFGHLFIVALIKITGVTSAVGYNLSVSFLLACLVTCVYSLVKYLTKNRFLGIFGGFLLALGGNLDFLFNFMRSNYFYAEARGLIAYTINEFPAYSFLISDLHAHIINLVFVVLFITLILYYYFENLSSNKAYFHALIAFNLGVLGSTNSWDLIVYSLLYFVVMLMVHLKPQRPFILNNYKLALKIFFTVVGSVILFIPFYLYFKPATFGILLVAPTLNLFAIYKMFGFFLIVILPVLIIGLKNIKVFAKDKRLLIILILAVLGITLIFVPDFLVVKDIYFKLNPPYMRANTVFKFWYQAWVVLSICAPLCILYVYNSFKFYKLKVLYFSTIIFLSFFIFGYTLKGISSIVGPKYRFDTLDGLDYLKTDYLAEYKMITWLNNNVDGSPVVLEAFGSSYTMDSVISANTGLPTVVGWSDHELGWRDNWPFISNRLGEVERMYKSTSITDVQDLVEKYKVKYIVIGTNEYKKFGESAGAALRKLYTPIITQDNKYLLSTEIF